jgi:putrescine transport system ATP-binding protein
MSVEKNIAFGLQQDGCSKSEITDRVDDILRLVELQGYKKRRPQQLSGGQRQRVALARALVKEPKLLLLDEPLGALDKKLREQTQFELMNIQDKVGVTFVVVTHDQEEAMTLATRIAVMDQGKFVQIGTPTEIYEFPENRFIADFIGSANIFEGKVIETSVNHLRIKTEIGDFDVEHNAELPTGSHVYIGLRPEKIHLSKQAPKQKTENQTTGVIDDIGYLGNTSRYKVRLENGRIIDVTAPNQVRPKSRTHHITWEDGVYIHWDASSSMLLNK